ncbi:MAG: DUF2442 domain-containing protein [Ignavibacteriae bacterium]|nr:DUF2442 domain-containing protein [Ignavibacteriota bacterium]
MMHPLYKILDFKIIDSYTLQIFFDDNNTQVINFLPVLEGEMYGPLKNLILFNQVSLDKEVLNLVWPNGADFDTATLHDWDQNKNEILSRVSKNIAVTV